MSRRRVGGAAGWAALSFLLLVGCNNDDNTGATKNAPLFEFNAAENGGRTVRWPNLPIRVFLGGVARADEVTAWTGATGGAVTFTFVGSAGAADITFDASVTNPGICGLTDILFDEDGRILAANIAVNGKIFRSAGCVRTVTHETAHGIGFLGHTDEGGLMDDDGGNGAITPVVALMLRDLYLSPHGTLVIAQAKQLPLRRHGGKKTITFVHPVRR